MYLSTFILVLLVCRCLSVKVASFLSHLLNFPCSLFILYLEGAQHRKTMWLLDFQWSARLPGIGVPTGSTGENVKIARLTVKFQDHPLGRCAGYKCPLTRRICRCLTCITGATFSAVCNLFRHNENCISMANYGVYPLVN